MKVKTLIIGGGISGLTLAANCKNNYLVIEKESTLGGLCRTFHQDGFTWDFAGHFFHFATKEVKEIFENEINPKDVIKCVKNTNINYFNNNIDYPFQANIHQLPKDEFIDCLYDLFNKNEKDNYLNFEEMLYGKFGKSITNKFLKPYNEKLYACKLNELDTEAMGRFFPYADIKQIINNMKSSQMDTYNNEFEYPKSGAQFFIDKICKSVDLNKVMLNSVVTEISPKEKYAIVNNRKIHYENLVNTIPLNKFIQLLPKDYLDWSNINLSCNKVLVLNLGFDKKSINKNVHWTYFPNKDINFYRAGFYNNILNKKRLSMYIEIGYKENEEVDIDSQLKLTLDNLKKCNIIDDHKLISYNSLIINPAYVHITRDSIKTVNNVIDVLKTDKIRTIGRYGKWTYCSIEDCMLDAIKLSKDLCL